MKKILFFVLLVMVAGCTPVQDFSSGAEKILEIHDNNNSSLTKYSEDKNAVDGIYKEMELLDELELQQDQAAFELLLDYQLNFLEAESIFLESQKHGELASTSNGFSCKPRVLIIDSALMRNEASFMAEKAITSLKALLENYPEQAAAVNLSESDLSDLSIVFDAIKRSAQEDVSTIDKFCPIERSLELYKEEIVKKRKDLSEDYINNLTYAEAAEIWKEIKGYD
jgi:hypothetical protein